MQFLQNHKLLPKLLFVLIFCIICITAALNQTIFFSPTAVHMWRQSDVASYAYQYWHQGQSIWQPATMTLLGEKGRTVSEFPIVYYISAKMYSLFGYHDWYIRAIHFLLFVFGISALYALCRKFIYNPYYAILPAFLWMTMPFVFYYAPNFLPNIPATSCMFLAIYFFYNYSKQKKNSLLFIGLFFFIFGSVLKVTEAMIVFALLATYFFHENHFLKKSFYKEHAKEIVLFFFSCVTICAWYLFARYYNEFNHTTQNLLSIIPIWDMEKNKILEIFHRAANKEWGWYFAIGSGPFYTFIFILQGFFIVKFRSLNTFFRNYTLWIILAIIVYSCLWFQAFYDHDYYMLPISYYPLILMITVFEYIARVHFRWVYTNTIILSALSILLMYTTYHNAYHQRERYFYKNEEPKFISNIKQNNMIPYLRSLGIKADDIVVCSTDNSPNIALYFLQLQGWTTGQYRKIDIPTFVEKGAKYLIVIDSSFYQDPKFINSKHQLLGEHKGVGVFSIEK